MIVRVLFLSLVFFAFKNGLTFVNSLSLNIFHINDFHSSFVQYAPGFSDCPERELQKGNCFGGIARLATAIRFYQQNTINSIILNAGDNFQGSVYYNIKKAEVIWTFMNRLPFDAITVGNHEFDDGIKELEEFLKHSCHPVVVANIDSHAEPGIRNYLKSSIVIEREGRKIGIIGVILATTPKIIADPGRLIFEDEIKSLNEESEKLKSTQDVDIFIALSHCGFYQDLVIAEGVKNIDIIVGGHTHHFLYTGEQSEESEKIDGKALPYPTVVENCIDGRNVLVVQAGANGRYLGHLMVDFDDNGNIIQYGGNPILMDQTIGEDPDTLVELQKFTDEVSAKCNTVIGRTSTELKGTIDCRKEECTLGNFITDAVVNYYMRNNPDHGTWTYVAVAILNAGLMKKTIAVGRITYGNLIEAIPYSNNFNVMELSGQDITDMLELTVATSFFPNKFSGKTFLQVSGIYVVFNLTRPAYSRIEQLQIRCQACENPTYGEVEADKLYRVAVPNYLLTGGDGFDMIARRSQNYIPGPPDVDIVQEYIESYECVSSKIEGRINVEGEWPNPNQVG